MSDSDAPVFNVSAGVVDSADGGGLVATPASPAALWTAWEFGAVDAQPVQSGIDLVSGDNQPGEWFPSVAAAQLGDMALAVEPDSDPLVRLPPSEFVLHESNLDDGYAFAAIDAGESNGDGNQDHSLHALTAPADYGKPLDHIEWHFTGLLPLV
jgi:hypothetical protein